MNLYYMDTPAGYPSKNHEVMVDQYGTTLYSYRVPVAYKPHKGYVGYVDYRWVTSVTTRSYVRRFLEDREVDFLQVYDLDRQRPDYRWLDTQQIMGESN